MNIIKLNAIDSTNVFLKQMHDKGLIKDATAIVTYSQQKGKGQHATTWQSEPTKNLALSLFKPDLLLTVDNKFSLSKTVSIALISVLQNLGIPDLSIKWPNDILSGNKKIAGILIETVVKGQEIKSAIIGIGLNVNQEEFKKLPKASSLKLISGRTYNLDYLVNDIVTELDTELNKLAVNGLNGKLHVDYLKWLYKLDQKTTFKTLDSAQKQGVIKGVDQSGRLQVLFNDEDVKAFDLKEITMIY